MKSRDYLDDLHKKSLHNREWLAASKICGCFSCLGHFEYQKISRWIGHEDTALCPLCGIDAVLGFDTEAVDAELLRQMHDHWFRRSFRLTADGWKEAVQNNAWPPGLSSPSTRKPE